MSKNLVVSDKHKEGEKFITAMNIFSIQYASNGDYRREEKKLVSIGHFPTSFCLQSLQICLSVGLNREQLYVLKIKEK